MKRTLLTFGAAVLLLLLAAGFVVYRYPLWVADQSIHFNLRKQHVQSEYVDVGPYKVHYYEALPPHGKDNGTPLVLIHGLGSRGEDWSGMIPTLSAQGFHVYAPDLLGYGRSSKPDLHYTIAEQEALVTGFLQAVHVQRTELAGWSMGGWVALKVTVDHPELVERLVVLDSAGIYFPATYDETLFTPTDRSGLDRLVSMLSPKPKHLPGFVARAALRKLGENAWVIDRSVGSMLSGHDLLDFQLSRITAPTLIVWGAEDRLIPLATGESMHRKITNSNLLVVGGCGHLAPQECTAPILKGTLQFLTAQPPPQGTEETVPGH